MTWRVTVWEPYEDDREGASYYEVDVLVTAATAEEAWSKVQDMGWFFKKSVVPEAG